MRAAAALALACGAALCGCASDDDVPQLPKATRFTIAAPPRFGARPKPAAARGAPDVLALTGVNTRVVGISLPSGKRRSLLQLGGAGDPALLALQGWSPDGRSFAVTSGIGVGRPRIVLVDLAAHRRRTIRPRVLDGTPYSVTFSPDGRFLLIPSERRHGLFAYDLRGGRTTRVATGPFASSFTPSWSPDGRRFAFTRNVSSGILVGDLARRAVRVLTPDGYGPAWSPDGERIAFTSHLRAPRECSAGRCHTSSEIDVIRADGTGRRRLTHTPVDESGPSWSPDGRWLVALRREEAASPQGSRTDLVALRADGSCYKVIPAPPGDAFGIGPNAWRPGSHAAPRC